MRVAVKYMAQVRQAAGRADEVLELESGCSLRDLVHRLTARHGPALERLLLSGDRLHDSILLFVSDEQVRWETPRSLKDGDIVTVLAPMAGG
ncbi:MAG: MoaD/ThiS family protein [Gemmataceae bacterium]|nr:MoaD/ThiS family protein [Gemmataceae bacterium]